MEIDMMYFLLVIGGAGAQPQPQEQPRYFTYPPTHHLPYPCMCATVGVATEAPCSVTPYAAIKCALCSALLCSALVCSGLLMTLCSAHDAL